MLSPTLLSRFIQLLSPYIQNEVCMYFRNNEKVLMLKDFHTFLWDCKINCRSSRSNFLTEKSVASTWFSVKNSVTAATNRKVRNLAFLARIKGRGL
jgi:hypothetical protein